jgi:hypothetical protein
MRTPLFILSIISAATLYGQVTFENVSTVSGLTYQGRSWGSSWGDINGDGHMDLYMSCHQHQYEPYFTNDSIRIFLNSGNGHFDDTIYTVDDGGQSDVHGGVFYDQDNDGDQDMFVVTGGQRYEIFLKNDGGTHLNNRTEELNLIFENARGRQTTLLDADKDGMTDLLINNQRVTNPPGQGSVLMLADPDSGYVKSADPGFMDEESRVSLISDLDGDGHTDLCVVNGSYLRLYSLTENGQFIEEGRLDIPNIVDVSIADFNGDLLPDIFVARGRSHDTDIQLFNDSALHASFNVKGGLPPASAMFGTNGPIEVVLSSEDYGPYTIHIGSDPGSNEVDQRQVFTLNPDQAQGFQDPLSFPNGMHCSFGILPNGKWKIEAVKNGPGPANSMLLEVKSSSPITGLTSVGMPPMDSTVRDILLLNQGGFQFTPSSSPAFLLDEYSANVASGDLDNDMDIDLFVVSTGRAKNRKTHLYENLGNGNFTVHENGWGTKGDVAGIGDAVTVTDFDNDGFLDLFVTNGSTNVFLDSAGVDLYRNLGNGNHWIKLDLQGVQSNPDGFGARVILQANGVEQVRDMTGGIHLVCQDDRRLHFGLGAADSIDVITVYWPSGVVDVLEDPDVDQIMTIVEGEHQHFGCPGNEEALVLALHLDQFGSQTRWKLLNAEGVVVLEGGPFADGDTLVTDTICVPPGCYKLKVFDSNSDGMGAGGYVLTNGNGERIIDANGAFGAVSFAKTTFCLPLGEPHLIEADCDQVLTDGDAITSSTVAGATQYRFFVFDPHGTYKRIFYRANGVLGANGMAQLPKNLELNVRVNAKGPSLETGYGPTCRLTIMDPAEHDLEEPTEIALVEDHRIELWPNPLGDGSLNLSIVDLGVDLRTVEVAIHDALGQVVFTQALPLVEGALNTVLEPGQLADGIYLLRATTADGTLSRHLVVRK